jgi:branched-chain amino acid transport system substrate-binding protein
MSKRLLFVFTVLMVATMALSACGPKVTAYECTDALGCVTVAAGEPVHLAYAMVINGPDATLGIDSRNGVEIAIAEKGASRTRYPTNR